MSSHSPPPPIPTAIPHSYDRQTSQTSGLPCTWSSTRSAVSRMPWNWELTQVCLFTVVHASPFAPRTDHTGAAPSDIFIDALTPPRRGPGPSTTEMASNQRTDTTLGNRARAAQVPIQGGGGRQAGLKPALHGWRWKSIRRTARRIMERDGSAGTENIEEEETGSMARRCPSGRPRGSPVVPPHFSKGLEAPHHPHTHYPTL